MTDKNEIIKIKLDNITYGGDSIGRLENGMTVFVPDGIPGEEVLIKIKEVKSNYARGELINIITKSKNRVDPPCEVFSECGGCQLQHMNYSIQLDMKRIMVKDSLVRIGGVENPKVRETIPAEYPWQYRNKAQFPLTSINDEIKTGFYKKGTHQLVVNKGCMLQHPLLNRIAVKTLQILNEYELSVYDEEKHRGLLRHLMIRAGVCTNQGLLTIVTRNREIPFIDEIAEKIMNCVPELVGILHNINPEKTNVILGDRTELIRGKKKIIDYIGTIKYEISPESFFQVNTLQTEKLYKVIKDYAELKAGDLIMDCYSGIGSISLYLAGEVKRVIGIEEVSVAVKDALRNAVINGLSNCDFISGKVEEKLESVIQKQGLVPDVLIFDPPRKGVNSRILDLVKTLGVKKIIYVSCNPSTLARDIKRLDEDYRLQKVQPVDMFPQTYHIETVSLLEKR